MSSETEGDKKSNIDGDIRPVFFGVLEPLISLIVRLLVLHDLETQSDDHDKKPE